MNQIVNQYADIYFDALAVGEISESGQNAMEFYNGILKEKIPDLPIATDAFAQIEGFDDAPNIMAALGISPAQFQKIKNDETYSFEDAIAESEPNSQQVLNFFSYTNQNVYNTFLNQNAIDVEAALSPQERLRLGLTTVDSEIEDLERRLSNPNLSLEEKAQIETQLDQWNSIEKDILLKRQMENIRLAQDYVFAASAIASLFAPEHVEDIQVAETGFNAAITIYASIAKMVSEGTLTAVDVGNVASAANMLLQLMRDNQSADQLILENLQTVLENQAEMLIRLERIERKVEILDEKVSFIIELLGLSFEEVFDDLEGIKENLLEIERDLVNQTEIIYVLSEESAFNILKSTISLAVKDNVVAVQRRVIDTVKDDLIFNETFTRRQTLSLDQLSLPTIDEYMLLDSSLRYAVMRDMVSWLNSFANSLDLEPINTLSLSNLTHPTYATALIREYNLLGERFSKQQDHQNASNSPVLLSEEIEKLDAASETLRGTRSLAKAVLDLHLSKVEKEIEELVFNEDELQK